MDHQHHSAPHKVTIWTQKLWSLPLSNWTKFVTSAATIYETGEQIRYQPRLDSQWFEYFKDLTGGLPNDKIMLIEDIEELSVDADLHIDEMKNQDIRVSIRKTSTGQFTRRQLKARPDFNEWLSAEFKQLDTHDSDGMFGDPCPRPKKSVVLRSIWTYILKKDGTKKARNCGDGRPLRDDHFRRLESIYTACVSQVGYSLPLRLY